MMALDQSALLEVLEALKARCRRPSTYSCRNHLGVDRGELTAVIGAAPLSAPTPAPTPAPGCATATVSAR